MEENRIIADFKNIKKYAAYASINERLESKEGLITLKCLDNQITKMRLVRNSVLETFTSDCLKTLKKYNKDKVSIDFNPKKLFIGNCLDLNLKLVTEEFNLLVSRNKIEKTNHYSILLDDKMNQIYKYIEGLFRVLENEKTSNLLSNNFYDYLYLLFSDYKEEFWINGEGARLSVYSSVFKNLTDEEELDALKFFYDNRDLILERIFFNDNKILDNYRTSVSKRKALSIYKRG